MNANEFMGLLIAGLITILGALSILVTLCVKPLIALNKSITTLSDNVGMLTDSYKTLNTRVTNHGKELDDHEKRIIKIECKEGD